MRETYAHRRFLPAGALLMALLLAALAPATAGAMDFRSWLGNVWTTSPSVRVSGLALDEAKRKQLADIKATASFAEIPDTFGIIASGVVEVKNGKLLVAGKELTFTPYNPKEPIGKRTVAMRWEFTLDQDQTVLLGMRERMGGMFLNGEGLEFCAPFFWGQRSAGGNRAFARKGVNVVYALCYNGKASLDLIMLPERDLRRSPDSVFMALMRFPSEEAANVFADILNEMARDIQIDPQLYVQAFSGWAEMIDGLVTRDPDGAHHTKFIDTLRHICWQLQPADYYQVLSRLRVQSKPWAGIDFFVNAKEFNSNLTRRYVQEQLGRHDTEGMLGLCAQVAAALEKREYNDDNWRKYAQMLEQIMLRDCVNAGEFEVGARVGEMALEVARGRLKMPADDKFVRSLEGGVSRLKWLQRTAVSDVSAPEAEQFFLQIRQLLEGGVPDQAGIQRIYNIYLRQGNLLLQQGYRAVALRVAILEALDGVEGARAALAEYARGRVGDDLALARERGDLQEIAQAVTLLEGLVDTAPIQFRLLQLRIERGDWAEARYQAIRLSGLDNTAVAAQAYLNLFFVESRLGFEPGSRTPLPAHLAAQQVRYRGKTPTLEKAIEQENGGQPFRGGVSAGGSGGPGRYLHSLPVSAGRSPAAWGGTANFRNERFSFWQPVEPTISGGNLVVRDHEGVRSVTTGGKPVWSYWLSKTDDYSAASGFGDYTAVVEGRDIYCLGADPETGLYSVFSFDNGSGRINWSSRAADDARSWTVSSVPYAAFGRLFALALDRSPRDNMILGVTTLSADGGEYGRALPLISLRQDYPVSNFSFSQHFAADAAGVYGWSGSGGLFAAGVGNALDWVLNFPVSGESMAMSPVGLVQPVGEVLTAYLPDTGELLGVNKATGRPFWRWYVPGLRYIHSRGETGAVIATFIDGERTLLCALDPRSGEERWRANISGLPSSGEGCVRGGRLYLPAGNGVAVFSAENGDFVRYAAMKDYICKIREEGGVWSLIGRDTAHIFGGAGEFEPDKAGAAGADKAAIAPVAEGAKSVARQMGDLYGVYPEAQLSLDTTKWSSPRFLHLNADMYAVYNDSFIAVFREGTRDKDGRFTPPAVVWSGYYPGLRIGEGYFVSYSAQEARFCNLADGAEFFRFQPISNGRIGGEYAAIRSVELSGWRAAVFYASGAVSIIDLEKRQVLPVYITVKHNHQTFFAGNYVLGCQWKNQAQCFDISKDGKMIWESKDMLFPRGIVGGEYLASSEGGQIFLTKLADGKRTKLEGGELRQSQDAAIINGGLAVFDSANVYDLKNGKRVVGANVLARDLLNPGVQVVLNSTQHELTLIRDGKAIKLEQAWIDYFWDKRYSAGSLSCGLAENELLVWVGDRLFSFDAQKGTLLKTRRLTYGEEWRSQILGRSIMLHASFTPVLFFLGDGVPAGGYAQVGYRLAETGADWPQAGWGDWQKVGLEYWQGQAAPRGGFAFRVGADAARMYLELAADQAALGEDYYLTLSAHDTEMRRLYTIGWSLADETGVTPLFGEMRGLNASVFAGDKGGKVFRLAATREAIANAPDEGLSPRYILRLMRREAGREAGSFVFGGMTGPAAEQLVDTPFVYQDCQRADNFKAREKLYSEAASFFPQGGELLEWLRVRRLAQGYDGNIKFLEEMSRRTAESLCVTNVLAALLLERFYQYLDSEKGLDPASEKALGRFAEIIKEVKDFAANSKIAPELAEVALSGVMVMRYYADSPGAPGVDFRFGANKKRAEYGGPTGRNSPLVTPRFFRQLITIPCGALSNDTAPTDISRLLASDAALGRMVVFSPSGGLRIVVGDDGKAGKDTKIEPEAQPRIYDAAGKLNYNWLRRGTTISFPALELPEIKLKAQMSADDLLLALKNLPSDSTIGLNIVQSYLNATRETEGAIKELELYRILLSRVSLSGGDLGRLADALRRLFADGERTPVQVMEQVADFMREHGVARSAIRRIFLQMDNLFEREGSWQIMEVPGTEEAFGTLDDKPEQMPNPPAQAYRSGETEFSFAPVAKVSDAFKRAPENRQKRTVYLYGTINAQKAGRVYVFFTQTWAGRGRFESVSGWLNMDQVFADEEVPWHDRGLLWKALRVEKGENRFLLRMEVTERGYLRINMGDTNCVPLDWAELAPLPPKQEEEKK